MTGEYSHPFASVHLTATVLNVHGVAREYCEISSTVSNLVFIDVLSRKLITYKYSNPTSIHPN